MNVGERERRWLHDPMGPRRWTITGLFFLIGGAIIYALHAPSRATTGIQMRVGALVALAGVLVEIVIRARLKFLTRRANPGG